MECRFVVPVIACTFTAMSFMACRTAHGEKTSTFKVYGNCEMCEENIETALDRDGIYSASWNKDTKMIRVKFDSTRYVLNQIYTLISEAGYDTETTRATDEAYMRLDECCRYERPM